MVDWARFSLNTAKALGTVLSPSIKLGPFSSQEFGFWHQVHAPGIQTHDPLAVTLQLY